MPSVVITGASTGIGRATALQLDRAGWTVFAGVRKPADADSLRAEASARLTPVRVDVTDAASIQEMATHVGAAVGEAGLQGLVNNAGIATGGVLEFVDLNELRRVLETNVVGQVAVTQALLPLLRCGRGRIVMMSSIAGKSSTPIMGLYAASKHALEAISDALRLELHPWGIHVAAVEPGVIETPIWSKALTLADRVVPHYPPEVHRLYGPLINAMLDGLKKVRGIPATAVADAVEHALTAKRPKVRYPVGRDAKFMQWVGKLPDRWRDKLILSRAPLYGG